MRVEPREIASRERPKRRVGLARERKNSRASRGEPVLDHGQSRNGFRKGDGDGVHQGLAYSIGYLRALLAALAAS